LYSEFVLFSFSLAWTLFGWAFSNYWWNVSWLEWSLLNDVGLWGFISMSFLFSFSSISIFFMLCLKCWATSRIIEGTLFTLLWLAIRPIAITREDSTHPFARYPGKSSWVPYHCVWTNATQ
jgi:hypothetical protein